MTTPRPVVPPRCQPNRSPRMLPIHHLAEKGYDPMMEFALVTSREKPVPLAPPCSSPRNPAHFHCVSHHVGFEFLRTVQRHVDARCVVVYFCPQHGPELPY